MSEEEFMKSTPKKLFKLAEIHSKMNTPPSEEDGNTHKKKSVEEKYIDEL